MTLQTQGEQDKDNNEWRFKTISQLDEVLGNGRGTKQRVIGGREDPQVSFYNAVTATNGQAIESKKQTKKATICKETAKVLNLFKCLLTKLVFHKVELSRGPT